MGIGEYLARNGPCLSCVYRDYVTRSEGISEQAARKRVSRARPPVHRLTGKHLPKREAFLYLAEQYRTEEFFRSLESAYIHTGSAPGRLLQGLRVRGGGMPRDLLPIASGLPVGPCKNQVSHDSAQAVLLELGLIHEEQGSDGASLIVNHESGVSRHFQSVAAAEGVVLGHLKSRLGHLAITTPNATEVRGEAVPQFGAFCFDFVGPSYLSWFSGSGSDGGTRNGFVVGDVILDQTVTLETVAQFLKKLSILWGQGRRHRFGAFIVGDFFDADCFNQLRKLGVVPATVTELVGRDAAAQLKQLIGTLENAAAAVASAPEEVFSLMSAILSLEGAALNLRSALFEMIMGRLFSLAGYGIDIRQRVRDDRGEEAEIDIKATNVRECICAECKGMAPGNLVDVDVIEDWVGRVLPRINAWAKRQDSLPNVRFEFIVSTGYTSDALKLTKALEAKHKKRPIQFFDRREVSRRLDAWNQAALRQLFRDQFEER